jgi:hypothetical protein
MHVPHFTYHGGWVLCLLLSFSVLYLKAFLGELFQRPLVSWKLPGLRKKMLRPSSCAAQMDIQSRTNNPLKVARLCHMLSLIPLKVHQIFKKQRFVQCGHVRARLSGHASLRTINFTFAPFTDDRFHPQRSKHATQSEQTTTCINPSISLTIVEIDDQVNLSATCMAH